MESDAYYGLRGDVSGQISAHLGAQLAPLQTDEAPPARECHAQAPAALPQATHRLSTGLSTGLCTAALQSIRARTRAYPVRTVASVGQRGPVLGIGVPVSRLGQARGGCGTHQWTSVAVVGSAAGRSGVVHRWTSVAWVGSAGVVRCGADSQYVNIAQVME